MLAVSYLVWLSVLVSILLALNVCFPLSEQTLCARDINSYRNAVSVDWPYITACRGCAALKRGQTARDRLTLEQNHDKQKMESASCVTRFLT